MKAPIVKFLGRTTRRIYAFMADAVPAALLDTKGNPVTSATYNGETVVFCNSQDGSVARGTAGAPPPQDIYAPGYAPSTWEQL